MTDAPAPTGPATTQAQGEVDRLERQAATLRAVLVQLLQDIVRAESCLDHSRAAQLLEANERLVVSAVDAMSEAESAHGALDEIARVGGLDPLTGLPNRALLLDRFESAIAIAKRRGNRVAVLFVDMNAFKLINDSLGHAAGDQALQRVAACLASVVRETDTVSRHGGDEFLILLADIAQPADAARVAEKVNVALAGCGRIDDQPVDLSASIGISIYPDDGEDPETLIERADAAMYLAKVPGQGAFVFHADSPVVRARLPVPAAALSNRPPTPLELQVAEQDRRHEQLREANERLVLAALGAQELLAAAEATRRREAELLAQVAEELGSPFAPIRLAASTLGLEGRESMLMARVRSVIEAQVEKLSRMVGDMLDPKAPGAAPATPGGGGAARREPG
jgi:diguanylate cyclase (GGDEF)-like protein